MKIPLSLLQFINLINHRFTYLNSGDLEISQYYYYLMSLQRLWLFLKCDNIQIIKQLNFVFKMLQFIRFCK